MREKLIDAFEKADTYDDVRVIIATGAGRAFCTGAELSKGRDTFNFDDSFRDGSGQVALRIYESKKPVIGAINGPGVGIGVTMILPMDIRIGSQTARFGFVFTRRGVVPKACSSLFLPRIVGIQQAPGWVFSGRVFEAPEVLAGGLVKEVVPPDAPMPRAREIACKIATNTSAVSVALARQVMWRMLGADHPMEAHKIDAHGIAQTGRTADAKGGAESFL